MKFVALWPILDQDKTMQQLQAEADLPELLFAARVRQTGPVAWSVQTAAETRLRPVHAALYLRAECDGTPWVEPRRDQSHRDVLDAL